MSLCLSEEGVMNRYYRAEKWIQNLNTSEMVACKEMLSRTNKYLVVELGR